MLDGINPAATLDIAAHETDETGLCGVAATWHRTLRAPVSRVLRDGSSDRARH